MTFRQRLGLGIPPVLLRVCLAVTFIWAGAGKYFGRTTLSPEHAAIFDAIHAGGGPAGPSTPAPPAETEGSPTARLWEGVVVLARDQGATPEPPPDPDAEPAPEPDAPAVPEAEPPLPPHRNVDMVTVLFRVWSTPNDRGEALLPAFMGQGKTPWRLAISLLVVEALGGVMVGVGLLTRFWSLMLAGVMAGALWTTSIGPVVVYGQPGWPGFMPVLPALNNFSAGAWQGWLWQLALLSAALSLACLGAGRLSLDRWIFGKPGAEKPEPIILDEED